MKIEWVEDKFADLAGENGAFNTASAKKKGVADSKFANTNAPKKMVPMLRTCHGDLVKVPDSALGK